MNEYTIYAKFVAWILRYTACVLFIIAFNTKNWFEYNATPRYIHYGLWHYCDSGSCYSLPWSDQMLKDSAIVPRSLMLPAFLLTFLSFVGSFIGVLANNNLYFLNISACVEFFGGILLLIGFSLSISNNLPRYDVENGVEVKANVGFSAVMALLSSLLYMLTSITTVITFCVEQSLQASKKIGSQESVAK